MVVQSNLRCNSEEEGIGKGQAVRTIAIGGEKKPELKKAADWRAVKGPMGNIAEIKKGKYFTIRDEVVGIY